MELVSFTPARQFFGLNLGKTATGTRVGLRVTGDSGAFALEIADASGLLGAEEVPPEAIGATAPVSLRAGDVVSAQVGPTVAVFCVNGIPTKSVRFSSLDTSTLWAAAGGSGAQVLFTGQSVVSTTLLDVCRARDLRWFEKTADTALQCVFDAKMQAVTFIAKDGCCNVFLQQPFARASGYNASSVHIVEFKIDACGDDENTLAVGFSFGFDPADGKNKYDYGGFHQRAKGFALSNSNKGHQHNNEDVRSDQFKRGDTITARLDLDKGTLSFMINGRPSGYVFSSLPTDKTYYAGISCQTAMSSVRARLVSSVQTDCLTLYRGKKYDWVLRPLQEFAGNDAAFKLPAPADGELDSLPQRSISHLLEAAEEQGCVAVSRSGVFKSSLKPEHEWKEVAAPAVSLALPGLFQRVPKTELRAPTISFFVDGSLVSRQNEMVDSVAVTTLAGFAKSTEAPAADADANRVEAAAPEEEKKDEDENKPEAVIAAADAVIAAPEAVVSAPKPVALRNLSNKGEFIVSSRDPNECFSGLLRSVRVDLRERSAFDLAQDAQVLLSYLRELGDATCNSDTNIAGLPASLIRTTSVSFPNVAISSVACPMSLGGAAFNDYSFDFRGSLKDVTFECVPASAADIAKVEKAQNNGFFPNYDSRSHSPSWVGRCKVDPQGFDISALILPVSGGQSCFLSKTAMPGGFQLGINEEQLNFTAFDGFAHKSYKGPLVALNTWSRVQASYSNGHLSLSVNGAKFHITNLESSSNNSKDHYMIGDTLVTGYSLFQDKHIGFDGSATAPIPAELEGCTVITCAFSDKIEKTEHPELLDFLSFEVNHACTVFVLIAEDAAAPLWLSQSYDQLPAVYPSVEFGDIEKPGPSLRIWRRQQAQSGTVKLGNPCGSFYAVLVMPPVVSAEALKVTEEPPSEAEFNSFAPSTLDFKDVKLQMND